MSASSVRLTASVCNGADPQRDDAPAMGLLPVSGTLNPTSVRTLRVLGHGRAAEARLVEVTTETNENVVCVEKVFHPGLLTRSIFRAAYQTSFAYQYHEDAIKACFYRRRVAAAIVEAIVPEARVAKPLYVRWDNVTQALVLASEFVRGRGIIPQDVDRRMVRRWLVERFSGRAAAEKPTEEINELLSLMTRLESLLIECGLTGSGWQVCKRAMVSTANLLRTESGYVVVDLESGIPSVLVPVYVIQGLRLGTLPLFDDLNPELLRCWLRKNSLRLSAAIGEVRLQQLTEDVSLLIRHTQDWKLSEPAIGRRPWRLLSADFHSRFRSQVINRWERCGIVDDTSAQSLRDGRRFLTHSTFLLGLVPGRIGRFLQRLRANKSYRRHVQRWLQEPLFRTEICAAYAARKSAEWRSSGRVAPDFCLDTIRGRFLLHSLLACTTPSAFHRWTVDREFRRTQLTRSFLFCVSGHFQREFGRMVIRTRINTWRTQQRLTAEQSKSLTEQLDSPAIEEYVRGFGLHVGLKLLLPIVMPLKAGAAAAALASGNMFYFLLLLMLMPVLRTCVTLWRMLASGQSLSGFRQALFVGVLPVVGSLAFPVQMSARFTDLSLFLMRDFASRLGCSLPVYGGKDSRTEMMAIKLVNLAAEGLDLWLSFTRVLQSSTSADANVGSGSDSSPTLRIGRWDHLAMKHLSLMNTSEAGLPISEDLQLQESQSRSTGRAA